MKTSIRLADYTVVSVKTAFELSQSNRKSVDKKIKKLLSTFDPAWAKDESIIESKKMGSSYDVYLALYDARQGFSAISRDLMMLV